MKIRHWRTTDERDLRRMYVTDVPWPQIAAALDRSISSVKSRAKSLGLRARGQDTPVRDAIVRALSEAVTPLSSAELLDAAYADREPPEYGLTVVYVTLHRLRRAGLPVSGGRHGYRIGVPA